MNQKNVSCKNINWQWFPRLAHAWDVLWYDIVSVDQIAHGKCDCRTVILAIIFHRSLVSESSVTGLGVYTRRWVYDNITPHSLCYLARVRPVLLTSFGSSWIFLKTSSQMPQTDSWSLPSSQWPKTKKQKIGPISTVLMWYLLMSPGSAFTLKWLCQSSLACWWKTSFLFFGGLFYRKCMGFFAPPLWYRVFFMK